MAGYKFEALKPEYSRRWAAMVINSSKTPAVRSAAAKINKGKIRYQTVETQTGVPWYFIGMIHLREGDCNFNTHLHNGDSLARRTVHVPAGRPVGGSPPFSWEFSAVDALKYEKMVDIADWSVEKIAYYSELYNGWGYRSRGFVSAYLWAGTNQYKSGKFIRDGVFDASVVDTQLGCMAVLKYLLENYVDSKETPPTDDPIVQEEEKPSSKAKVDMPTNSEMNEVSEKHWFTTILQWFGIGTGGSAAVYKAADSADLETTRNVVYTIKDIAMAIGAFGVIAICVGIVGYTVWMKWKMKQDVAEGRTTPSGGMPTKEQGNGTDN